MLMAQMLNIALLGDFRLYNGTEAVPHFDSLRLQSLLAYLVLHRGTPQSRQHLAFQLWPVSSESQARTNLRKLLLQLRRALPTTDDFLDFDNQTITWRADAPYLLDVAEVQQLLKGLATHPLDHAALTRLFEIYSGELLPSCYDDWIAPLRGQLHQDVMAALDHLVTLLENQRAYEEGIRYAQRLLAFDPLEEKAYQRLMRLRASNGDRAGALKVYQECVKTLERELGVAPAPETAALYQQLVKVGAEHSMGKPKARSTPDALPLVGRQREWQLLQTAWQRAARGTPSFVTISGEAGIGKTRLAEELLLWAERQGIATVRTRSYQAQGALAYAPIADLLRAEVIHSRLHTLNDARLTQVARLLPELLDERPHLPAPQPMSEGWQRQQFYDALAQAVHIDRQPLLLLFDDLQWCDGETLAWLHVLLRTAGSSILLIVGTVRTGEIAPEHPLHRLFNTLRRDDQLTEIGLGALSAAEVKALAQSLDNAPLDAAQASQLYADTEGNPLFVVETVRAAANGVIDTATAAQQRALPPKVYSVIRARLAQLSPEAQVVANLAAVMGRSFTYAVLLTAGSFAEEELVDALDDLLARQIVREQGNDAYDFSHDRIRDVAYHEISHTRRRLLHRRVAEALEHIHAHDLGSISGRLAAQYKECGNRHKAIAYLQMAGDHAASQFSYAAAVRYFTEALALTTEAEPTQRGPLLLALLAIHHKQGNMQQWPNALAQLAQIVENHEQVHLLTADAIDRWRTELLINQAIYALHVGDYAPAHALATQAANLAQVAGELTLEAKALYWIGYVGFCGADFAQARPNLEAAAQKAKVAADELLYMKSLEVLMQVYMFSGGSAQRIKDVLDESMAVHRRTKNLQGQADIYNKYSYLPVAQGEVDFDEAQYNYALALALNRQIGNRSQQSNTLRNISVLATCAGDYRQALHTADDALRIVHEIHAHSVVGVVLNYLGFAYFNQGRIAEAQATQETALATLQQHNVGQWAVKALMALGWIHYYRGDWARALTYLRDGIAQARRLNEERQAGYTLTCLGHVLTALAQFAEAGDAYRQAMTLHERLGQTNRAQEPRAGLAHILLRQGLRTEALAQIEPILAYLPHHTLFATEESFHVYLFCYRILSANQAPQATILLQTIYTQLQARAATIDNAEHCRLFWEEMPGHAEIATAMKHHTANG